MRNIEVEVLSDTGKITATMPINEARNLCARLSSIGTCISPKRAKCGHPQDSKDYEACSPSKSCGIYIDRRTT